MKKQDYKNHVRYFIPHHFIFYPVILVLSGLSFYYAFKYPNQKIEFVLIAFIFLLMGWLSFMLRQHYALTLQNRIVILETRERYFELTGKRFSDIEHQLSFPQIAALRFAGDEEFLGLIEKAVDQNLSPKNIKTEIKDWKGDYMRV